MTIFFFFLIQIRFQVRSGSLNIEFCHFFIFFFQLKSGVIGNGIIPREQRNFSYVFDFFPQVLSSVQKKKKFSEQSENRDFNRKRCVCGFEIKMSSKNDCSWACPPLG